METGQEHVEELGDADGLWTTCAESIREQVIDAVWRTTFSGAKAVAFDEGELVLVAPNGLQKDRIEGRYLGMPCGVVINLGGVTLYHLGDTGLFSDLKLLGEIYQPDIACVPIGDRFTMGPDLATRAAEMIGPKAAIPIHYNTWPPIEQDPAKFCPSGIEVKVMQGGDTWTYG